jgi:glyoxylase I family protein
MAVETRLKRIKRKRTFLAFNPGGIEMATLDQNRVKKNAAKMLPQRLHHTARVVKDQEVTRKFYEDVIGMPMVAAWTEVGQIPEIPNEKINFCHTFFALADGGAMAFFQFAKPEAYEIHKAKVQTGFNHIALAVSREAQDAIQARLEAAGYSVRLLDHGYCRSIYVSDPDQLTLEFTSDPKDAKKLAEMQGKTAHATLKRWLSGDYTSNTTDLRHS